MLLPAVRLAAALNALPAGGWSPEVAAHMIVGRDTAHHVLDPDGVLSLDPLHATAVEDSLPAIARAESVGWLLVLPTPGRLGPLRGPATFNQAALEVGAAVVGCTGELALVPHGVGSAVQWRVHGAQPPRPSLTSYDAERALDATVRQAARTLVALDVAGGTRPADATLSALPAGVTERRRSAADKAVRLLLACEVALADDGGALSSYEADVRRRQLREVRDAASDALCAALSWVDPDAERPRSAAR